MLPRHVPRPGRSFLHFDLWMLGNAGMVVIMLFHHQRHIYHYHVIFFCCLCRRPITAVTTTAISRGGCSSSWSWTSTKLSWFRTSDGIVQKAKEIGELGRKLCNDKNTHVDSQLVSPALYNGQVEECKDGKRR